MQYTNPILFGDYSDPDVIRVGEDFYLISSSFTYLPGIPVLHSRDLVHWEQIGYAVSHLPFERYDKPAHKCGTWAPSIRYHNGLFYVYVCLPDEGLFAFTASDPAGTWECHHVKDVVGWIDPCPLFDEDGSAYLVHGFAGSRAGINNILYVHRMSDDGLSILDKGRLVYDGDVHGDTTVEGPKAYKKDGYYWILCPAGGVKPGYQLALRAKSIYGPYERQVVLRQGDTPVNGPHQGGWVDDGHGGDWFIHFQDRDAYGRITHLQPVDWSSTWPVMGHLTSPVQTGEIDLPPFDGQIPTSDDFRDGPGIQWQWQANPRSDWFTALHPGLRLHAAPAESPYKAGNFLSQLMQYPAFTMDAVLSMHPQAGDVAGLCMMGYTYHAITLSDGCVRLIRGEVTEINRWTPERVRETVIASNNWEGESILLRMEVRDEKVTFFFGKNTDALVQLGEACPMACGGWTGARPGLYVINTQGHWGGWADIENVQIRAI
ncbi:MAG: glycoside hydrolase 43 family protein [Clostridia bacterium]|nr:glycoside hydrolase 43 family protein [Clostridia bacterium]MBR1685783.1 glycoside hydrolase 43 family protein [Clostridia bacterium]